MAAAVPRHLGLDFAGASSQSFATKVVYQVFNEFFAPRARSCFGNNEPSGQRCRSAGRDLCVWRLIGPASLRSILGLQLRRIRSRRAADARAPCDGAAFGAWSRWDRAEVVVGVRLLSTVAIATSGKTTPPELTDGSMPTGGFTSRRLRGAARLTSTLCEAFRLGRRIYEISST